MKKENILFLDIDGVCNCTEVGISAYQWDYNHKKVPLNEYNIAALRHILENVPNLKIVWSTSWRMYDGRMWKDWINPRIYLEEQDWFKDHVIGITPKKMSSERHEEIMMWLNHNEENKIKDPEHYHDISNFVVVDDTVWGMHYFKSHYFKSYGNFGLTDEMANRIIDFFKEQHYNGAMWYPKTNFDITD